MFGGLTLAERVDLDFTRARRRAFVGGLARRLGRGASRPALLDFDEVRKSVGTMGGRRLGRKTVEVAKIVGSVGRSRDFDVRFMPAKRRLREKWLSVDRGFHRGEEPRSVNLYKIGEDYFVNDGNHRVSVARFQGVEMIDAEVMEFRPLPCAAINSGPPRREAAAEVEKV